MEFSVIRIPWSFRLYGRLQALLPKVILKLNSKMGLLCLLVMLSCVQREQIPIRKVCLLDIQNWKWSSNSFREITMEKGPIWRLFNSLITFPPVLGVIYQPRETVFHRDIQTWRRELKMRRVVEYIWRIRGVWIADETLSRAFDKSSQSKQKQRSERRRKIFKMYANQDRVSKPSTRLWVSLF